MTPSHTTRWLVLTALVAVVGAAGVRIAAPAAPPEPAPHPRPVATSAGLQHTFDESVLPFLKTYCVGCHGADKPKGDLDLSPFTTLESVAKDHKRWALVLERLK